MNKKNLAIAIDIEKDSLFLSSKGADVKSVLCYKADLVKREKMVGNLPIMQSIWVMKGISDKSKKQILTIMINRFFGDLEAQIYLDKNKF